MICSFVKILEISIFLKGEKIDLISTLSTGIGIPLCLLATFLVDSRGTKKGIHIGAALTILGK